MSIDQLVELKTIPDELVVLSKIQGDHSEFLQQ